MNRAGLRPRVLLIGPELILGWTESTTKALESLGCPTRAAFYNNSRLKRGVKGLRGVASKRLAMALPRVPTWLQHRYAAWLGVLRSRSILREARMFRPDLILVLKGESLRARTLQQLRDTTRATLTVWWIDHPFMNVESKRSWTQVPACIPLFDACFVFDHAYESELGEAGARMVKFLPCTVDPEKFSPQILTSADRDTYGACLSFVGTYYESRRPFLSALGEDLGLRVWGPGWNQSGMKRVNGIARQFAGEASFPLETCKIYNASLVNLNAHHPQSRLAGLNCRAFEIPAAGGFQLTDYVPGMETLLEPDRESAVYHCPEEAFELSRYYLKAESERRRIAEAGHRRVLAEHTYRHRMQTLLSALAV